MWRNLQYYFEPTSHETLLHRLLKEADVVDPGLGSTLRVLERHNLSIQLSQQSPSFLGFPLRWLGRSPYSNSLLMVSGD
ncbi:hypothetical protein [Calothrix sp. 336/3]|uniref:hypothetical protein n=1 Tax=Calothrix sp. 336/3 TaxID=1337936 RepID=UPI000AE1E505|nr:hypothetical protein [Calothrix sp. 336/3]